MLFIESFSEHKKSSLVVWSADSMYEIGVFRSKSSGFAKNSLELTSGVHSLAFCKMFSPLPRRASFFAAPKKEGKKRAFSPAQRSLVLPAGALAEIAPRGQL